MAVDEAILEAVGAEIMPPTLRLYRWDPACLSLGYAQPAADVDQDQLRAHGWTLVRRMTGGRAILHTDELTYSVTLPAAHPLAQGSIVESYRRLSAGLLATLEHLGVMANADKRASNKTLGAICFEVPSDYEITADGKKLLGSAQVRKQNAVLQHGTLPLWGDITRISDALAFADAAEREMARQRVVERATTVEHILQERLPWEAVAQAMSAAFAATFAIHFEPAILSEAEAQRAAELRLSRYAADDWTFRR